MDSQVVDPQFPQLLPSILAALRSATRPSCSLAPSPGNDATVHYMDVPFPGGFGDLQVHREGLGLGLGRVSGGIFRLPTRQLALSSHHLGKL